MTDMAPSSFFDLAGSTAVAEVVAVLEEIADAELATGMAAYMRNQFQFFAVLRASILWLNCGGQAARQIGSSSTLYGRCHSANASTSPSTTCASTSSPREN